MCLEYDASNSWSGFLYQGKTAIYVALKLINDKYQEGTESSINDYFIEFEWVEDFSILKNNSDKLEYYSIHQVKAREGSNINAYGNAITKLALKLEKYSSVEKAYLHASTKLHFNSSDWEKSIENIVKYDGEIKELLLEANDYKGNELMKDELLIKIKSPGRKRVFINELNAAYFIGTGKKINTNNDLDDAIKILISELELKYIYISKGPSEDILKKIFLYKYDEEVGAKDYCELDKIDELIMNEIKTFWSRTSLVYKCSEPDSIRDTFIALLGYVDMHITKRHINYHKKEKDVVSVMELVDVLKQEPEHCKGYYIASIKDYYLNIINIEHEDCLKHLTDSIKCEICQIDHLTEMIYAMTTEEFEEFIHIINPDVVSDINRGGHIDYCQRSGIRHPFLRGIELIEQHINGDKKGIRFTDKSSKLYLLTALCDKGQFDPVNDVCYNIIKNKDMIETMMDYEVLISRDIKSNSILTDSGHVYDEPDKNNIYRFKDVRIMKLDDCIEDLKECKNE